MKRITTLLFSLGVLLLSTSFSVAQTSSDQWTDEINAQNQQARYWQIPTSIDAYPNQSLYLYFQPNERICKEKYDDDWYTICGEHRAMSDEQMNMPMDAIRIDPQIDGMWEWDEENRLAFYPQEQYAAETQYRIAIPKEYLPANVFFSTGSNKAPYLNLNFVSEPIEVSANNSFKFDPYDYKNMGISGVFRFNYSMDTRSVESRISLTPSSKNLRLSTPSYTWSTDKKEMYFNIPVLSLGEEKNSVDFRINAGAKASSRGEAIERVSMAIPLPAKQDIFTIETFFLESQTQADLNSKQVFTLAFTLPVNNSDVLEHIEAVLLPRDFVQNSQNQEEDTSPYKWQSYAEVTPEVLEYASPVTLVPLNPQDKPNLIQTFTFKEELPPGYSIYFRIKPGIKGPDTYALDSENIFLVEVPTFTEELRILQNGAVLSLSGDKTLALYSRNLDKVSFELAQARPEFISYIITSTGGSFTYPDPEYYDYEYYDYYSETPDMDVESLTRISMQELPLVHKNSQEAQFFSLNLAPWLDDTKKGIFYLETTGYRDNESVVTDKRFVIITDLGIIFKKNVDSSGEIYVASLDTGEPMSGVTINVLGKNGLSIFEAETNRDGQVNVPSFSGFTRDKMPVAITATHKEDFAYLPYSSSEHRENYSDFSVGGNTISQDNMYATMFTQRDLYKPGESIHFAFVVKQGEFNTSNLTDVPLTLILRDPRNNIFAEQDIILPKDGFGDASFDLTENAMTGMYRAELRLGKDDAVLDSISVNVEEFQPDTLNIKLELSPSQELGWLKPDQPIVSELTLTNLFGTPAVNHKTRLSASFHTTSFAFHKYPGWFFYDAARLQDTRTLDTMHMQTNDNGVAIFTIPKEFYADASGLLRVDAKAYALADSSVVSAQNAVFISPLDAVIGWKTSSNLDYLAQNVEAIVSLKAIDNTLEPYAFGEITLETVDISYTKSLVKNDNGEYHYTNLKNEEVFATTSIKLGKKDARFKLDTARTGEHMLIAKDMNGNVVLRITYYVAGESDAQFGENKEATLSARLSKTDYDPEEMLAVSLSLPYAGAGLITIEREKVYTQKWFSGSAGETIQNIKLPKGLEGRAYVNITYFRDREDKDIFTTPMASAVLPFTISMEAKNLDIELKIPSDLSESHTDTPIIRPGATFPVEIQTAKEAKAIVFAVDTGILQMTNYKTPNPLYDLLGNRALQVQTYEYFDMLMPDYSLIQEHISAFGGGLMMENEMMDAAKRGQNPFRRKGEASVAFWSGIIDVGPTKTVVDIPVPSYFSGQIRVMAVASSETGLSSAQSLVLSQAEVVIQSSLPLFATPGDVFETNVTLTDMSSPENTKGRNVNLNVKPSKAFELINPPTQPISLIYGEDTSLTLQFKVLEELGNQEIIFEVIPEKKKENTVTRTYALSVRPASTYTTNTEVGRLQNPPFEHTVNFEETLYPHYSELEANISNIPLPIAHGLMGYLEDYPYFCSEQIVSRAMPQVLLLQMPQFAPEDNELYSQENMRKDVMDTLYTISSRYGYNSYFSLWPEHGRNTSLFQTAYILDFITEAKHADLVVPRDLTHALEAMENTISLNPSSLSDARTKAYMAWVLTRNGVITTNSLANIVSWLDVNVQNWETDITAAFIAGSLKLMMQDAAAESLIRSYVPTKASEFRWSSSFDALTNHSLYITIVAEHFPELLSTPKTQAVLNEMFQLISSNRYVTHSAATATRALLRYSESFAKTNVESSIALLNEKGTSLNIPVKYDASTGSYTLFTGVTEKNNLSILPEVASIDFTSSAPGFWLVQSKGYPIDEPAPAIRNGMEVTREFRSPDGTVLTSVNAGDPVIVTIKAKSRSGALSDIMIVDLLPGGLEMLMAEGGSTVDTFTTQGAISGERKMDVDYVDRREDRIIISATITENETVFRYRTTASASGVFVLPPLSAQSMYNPDIHARTANDEPGGVGAQGTGFFVVE